MSLREDLNDLQKKLETVTKGDVYYSLDRLHPGSFEYEDTLVLTEFSQKLREFWKAHQELIKALKKVRGHFSLW